MNDVAVWAPFLFAGICIVALVVGLRQTPGGSDRSTKRRLAVIDRRLQLVMDHLGVTEPEPEASDLIPHLVAGKKIEAIKIYRERTGAGLKEAKDAVEDIARRHGIPGR